MDFQALLLTVFRFLLGSIFLVSSVSKANDARHFVNTLVSFKLFPTSWAQPFTVIIIGMELIVAALLLMGWQSRIAASLCGFLLLIFTVVICLSLMRGYTDLECGCFGSRHARKVNFNAVGRNIFFLVMALCIMLWGGGFWALDNYSFVWKKSFASEVFLPIALACVGILILTLLVRCLYFLLQLMRLEER